jgi:hypothetical protein
MTKNAKAQPQQGKHPIQSSSEQGEKRTQGEIEIIEGHPYGDLFVEELLSLEHSSQDPHATREDLSAIPLLHTPSESPSLPSFARSPSCTTAMPNKRRRTTEEILWELLPEDLAEQASSSPSLQHPNQAPFPVEANRSSPSPNSLQALLSFEPPTHFVDVSDDSVSLTPRDLPSLPSEIADWQHTPPPVSTQIPLLKRMLQTTPLSSLPQTNDTEGLREILQNEVSLRSSSSAIQLGEIAKPLAITPQESMSSVGQSQPPTEKPIEKAAQSDKGEESERLQEIHHLVAAWSKPEDIRGVLCVVLMDTKNNQALASYRESGGHLFRDDIVLENGFVLWSMTKTLRACQPRGIFQEMLISLDSQYHLIMPLYPESQLFLYTAFSRRETNPPLVRHQLLRLRDVLRPLFPQEA